MKYAELNGERVMPSPKTKALCQFCGSEVVAKCGKIRIWHWSHKTVKHCDHWWEPETVWHRNWKDQFPTAWQEKGRRDESGELHIADVLTPNELALEFQHSHIDRDEVEKRTHFHGNICWIVDGLRLQSSLVQFKQALENSERPKSSGAEVYNVYFSDSRLLKKWSGIDAPIVFDFGGKEVWVIGRTLEESALVYPLPKDLLVAEFKKGHRPPPIHVTQPQKRTISRTLYRPRHRRRRVRRF